MKTAASALKSWLALSAWAYLGVAHAPAMAQSKDFAACKAIKASEKRAACFEALAASMEAPQPARPPGTWEQEPDSVLGVKLGRPRSEIDLPPCPEPSYHATSACLYYRAATLPGDAPVYGISGHPFTYASFTISTDESGVVTKITAQMASDRFEQFLDAITTKYGPPHSSTANTVTNGFGAKLTSREVAWNGRAVSIHAFERIVKMDQAMVVFSDNASAKRQEEAKARKSKEAASKL